MLEQIGMTEKYKGWMDEVRFINKKKLFYLHINLTSRTKYPLQSSIICRLMLLLHRNNLHFL